MVPLEHDKPKQLTPSELGHLLREAQHGGRVTGWEQLPLSVQGVYRKQAEYLLSKCQILAYPAPPPRFYVCYAGGPVDPGYTVYDRAREAEGFYCARFGHSLEDKQRAEEYAAWLNEREKKG